MAIHIHIPLLGLAGVWVGLGVGGVGGGVVSIDGLMLSAGVNGASAAGGAGGSAVATPLAG